MALNLIGATGDICLVRPSYLKSFETSFAVFVFYCFEPSTWFYGFVVCFLRRLPVRPSPGVIAPFFSLHVVVSAMGAMEPTIWTPVRPVCARHDSEMTKFLSCSEFISTIMSTFVPASFA